MHRITLHSTAVTALFLAIAVSPSAGQVAPSGHVVLARTGPAALVLWDATQEVTDIVKTKTPDAQANDRLERGALRALKSTFANLKGSKTITIRITYAMTGAVSPQYGQATFAGIERYANLSVDVAALKDDHDKWAEASVGNGPLPDFASLKIVGTLPPR